MRTWFKSLYYSCRSMSEHQQCEQKGFGRLEGIVITEMELPVRIDES